MAAAHNMPPAIKKRAHSPEVDESSSTHQNASVKAQRKAWPKRRLRGPKDERLGSLLKLEKKFRRRFKKFPFQDTDIGSYIPPVPRFNARAGRTAPAPVESPSHTLPPSLPAMDDANGPENNTSTSLPPHIVPVSGLCKPSI